jgi:hypothetical protein
MAINKNHEFEEVNGIKCAIVEKNVSAERAEFLKQLLEFNRLTVVVAPSAPPKAAAPPKPAEGEAVATPPVAPATFTVGVTNLAFNSTNAIFGRLLRTRDGHIVTPAYWEQKESVSHDEIPYYEEKI